MKTDKMLHFGETLNSVMPDFDTGETESSLELKFMIWNKKYNIRRVRN